MKTHCRNWVIAGTIIIWLIKFGIRPYFHFDAFPKFVLGVAPNLLGSFLIPFGAVWFFEGRKNFFGRFFSIQSVMELRFICITGFVLLLINEYLQLFPVFGRTFDYYDIFFSAVGLCLSYFVFGSMGQYSLRELLSPASHRQPSLYLRMK